MSTEAERDDARRDLQRIRTLMERAGRYSDLSAWSCVLSGTLAVAGALACRGLGLEFRRGASGEQVLHLGLLWGGVFAAAGIQNALFTWASARRRGEPVWSPLARQVFVAVLPAFFVGAIVTVYAVRAGELELLPPLWMLTYGTALMTLGLYASGEIRLVGILFLALGAGALLWGREYGVWMMMISFGGLHLLLGRLLFPKSQAR
jgi:hypothetical protein